MKYMCHFTLIALMLGACTAYRPPVASVEVSVPVAVSGISGKLAEPAWNVGQLKVDSTAGDKLKAALADLSLAHGYIEELEAELSGCR